jgi:hypothetical protein
MRPAYFAAAFTAMLAAETAHAQSSGDLEARVRALEERVAALEGAAPAGAPAPATNVVRCKRLNVNGSGFAATTVLTVTVNGETVSTFNANAYGDLERYMRPGVNRVVLSFNAPGGTGPFGTNGELRCLAPDEQSSRDTILRLQPTRDRLSAEVAVEYVRG